MPDSQGMSRRSSTGSLFLGGSDDASLPGLLVALMTLFDGDGSRTLSKTEWMDGNAALDLSTSDDEWEMLLQRFGSDSETPDEISFANMMSIFGDMKPVEGFLEEILRRFMRTFVTMSARMNDNERQLRTISKKLNITEQKSEKQRQQLLAKIVRRWKNRSAAQAFGGWRELTQNNKLALARAATQWRNALLASVWRRWAEMREEALAMRAAVARAAGRWRNRFVAGAFVAWSEQVRATVELRGRAAARIVMRLAASAFNAWRSLAERSRHGKELQQRALVRIAHGLLAYCFDEWAETIADAVERRHELLVSEGAIESPKAVNAPLQLFLPVLHAALSLSLSRCHSLLSLSLPLTLTPSAATRLHTPAATPSALSATATHHSLRLAATATPARAGERCKSALRPCGDFGLRGVAGGRQRARGVSR